MKEIKFKKFLKISLWVAVFVTAIKAVWIYANNLDKTEFFRIEITKIHFYDVPLILNGYYQLISMFLGVLFVSLLIYIWVRIEKKRKKGWVLELDLRIGLMMAFLGVLLGIVCSQNSEFLVAILGFGSLSLFLIPLFGYETRQFHSILFPYMFGFVSGYLVFIGAPLLHASLIGLGLAILYTPVAMLVCLFFIGVSRLVKRILVKNRL